jgi:V8-like Glu-specific endopeptidase
MPLDFMQDEDILSWIDDSTEYHYKGFCQGQRTSQCVFSTTLIVSNTAFTALLTY